MSGQEKELEKGALKQLREERKVFIQKARERIKAQTQDLKKIKEEIKTEGKTVPEIAQGTGLPTSKVMWYISSMKKYGMVNEGEKDGAYFRYEMAKGK